MSPMLEDMQDMLFSATRRKRVLEESKSILFLTETDAGEVTKKWTKICQHKWVQIIYLSRHRN